MAGRLPPGSPVFCRKFLWQRVVFVFPFPPDTFCRVSPQATVIAHAGIHKAASRLRRHQTEHHAFCAMLIPLKGRGLGWGREEDWVVVGHELFSFRCQNLDFYPFLRVKLCYAPLLKNIKFRTGLLQKLPRQPFRPAGAYGFPGNSNAACPKRTDCIFLTAKTGEGRTSSGRVYAYWRCAAA